MFSSFSTGTPHALYFLRRLIWWRPFRRGWLRSVLYSPPTGAALDFAPKPRQTPTYPLPLLPQPVRGSFPRGLPPPCHRLDIVCAIPLLTLISYQGQDYQCPVSSTVQQWGQGDRQTTHPIVGDTLTRTTSKWLQTTQQRLPCSWNYSSQKPLVRWQTVARFRASHSMHAPMDQAARLF